MYGNGCEIEGIAVSDVARRSIEPDTCILSIWICERHESSSACLELGAKTLQRISCALSKVGIGQDALKTDSFDLSEDEKRGMSPRLVGLTPSSSATATRMESSSIFQMSPGRVGSH